MNNANGMNIGHKTLAMMERLGVSPLPRNYNLCYTCITTSDKALRAAVRNLGNSPTQADLDALIEEFIPEVFASAFMRRQQDDMIKNLEGVISQLNVDQNDAASFAGAIEKVSETLSRHADQDKVTPEMLSQVAGALVEASRRKVAAGNKTITNVEGKVDELGRLRDEIERLRRMANTDELTRLFNRRAFDETLSSHYAREDRSTFGLIMLDIDYFKKINDTYGHVGGDRILRMVADRLKSTMRQDSFLARTGGEEFAVLLKKTGPVELERVAERIREAIETMEFPTKAANVPDLKITVSVGASMATEAAHPVALYDLADKALYRSKNAGRNTVTIAGDEDFSSTLRYRLYATGTGG